MALRSRAAPSTRAISKVACGLLRGNQEMPSPILLPARFAGVATKRRLFAFTDNSNAISRHTQVHEIVFDRGGAPLTKAKVVFGAATFVAMSLDNDSRC